MSALTVASLSIGDIVADDCGQLGVVSGFHVNAVAVKWDKHGQIERHDDADLARLGVVLVEGAR